MFLVREKMKRQAGGLREKASLPPSSPPLVFDYLQHRIPNTDLVDPLVPAYQTPLGVPLVLEVLRPQEGLVRL